jgi:hypothetical protein
MSKTETPNKPQFVYAPLVEGDAVMIYHLPTECPLTIRNAETYLVHYKSESPCWSQMSEWHRYEDNPLSGVKRFGLTDAQMNHFMFN